MEELYQKLIQELESKLAILEDKPEETVQSTLNALWYKASGNPISVEVVQNPLLPKLTRNQESTLYHLIDERLNGKPLAYITGRQSFMGIELLSDNRALIPRKETEILTKAALQLGQKMSVSKPKLKIFDVCCGSGNIGLALASLLPEATIDSSDLSFEAVELTNENISFLNLGHRVKAKQSDLFSNFEQDDFYGQIDMVVCNPPYISSSKVTKMNSEISENEPAMAFDGGMLGLKVIQELIHDSPKFLTKNGWLIFEIGLGQGPFIIQLCQNNGAYNQIESYTDILGNIRAIAARCNN
jgi:release factor glutamine methyltransferase